MYIYIYIYVFNVYVNVLKHDRETRGEHFELLSQSLARIYFTELNAYPEFYKIKHQFAKVSFDTISIQIKWEQTLHYSSRHIKISIKSISSVT